MFITDEPGERGVSRGGATGLGSGRGFVDGGGKSVGDGLQGCVAEVAFGGEVGEASGEAKLVGAVGGEGVYLGGDAGGLGSALSVRGVSEGLDLVDDGLFGGGVDGGFGLGGSEGG
jgi:hypothetical protein